MASEAVGQYVLNEYMRYLQHKSRRIKMFDRYSGDLSNYYQSEVLPLIDENITENREQQFFEWIIKSRVLTPRCVNADDIMCRRSLKSLVKTVGTTQYRWLCLHCDSRMPVKDKSIFKELDCEVKTGVRILFGWAKGENVDMLAKLLGVKEDVVSTIYNRAALVIQKHLEANPSLYRISGIVLIDIYPNFGVSKNWIPGAKRQIKPILCITEIQSMPQKTWLQSVNMYDSNSPESLKLVKKQILRIIRKKVARSSTILLKVGSVIPFSEDELKTLTRKYSLVIANVPTLAQHNSGNRTLETALEAILKKPLSVCEEAQFFSPNNIDQFLFRHNTMQLAGGDHFRYLIEIFHSCKADDLFA